MLLQIHNLHAGYGDNEVLHGINLSVDAGEIVALIGPNGAGKSTVVKSVMGLAAHAKGSIIFQGKDITRLSTHALLEEGIGFVPQGRLVFPSLTARENLEMGGYLLRSKEQRVDRLAQVFGYFPVLKHKAHLHAGMLSGGEQQMLAIGRALMMTPKLLMLDEPSLGLSPKVTQGLFETLHTLNTRGTALLIVEQNVRLVLRYATRGYLMGAGMIRFEGDAVALGDEKLMHEAYLV